MFFDNLQLTHTRGPLLEEAHYYPFGLQMKALCSKAANALANNLKFNSGTELEKDFDISIYETPLRPYDPQMGRFTGVDILAQAYSSLTPYHFGGNNPVSANDPTGALMHMENQSNDEIQQASNVFSNLGYGQQRHGARMMGLDEEQLNDYVMSQLTGIETMFGGGGGVGSGGEEDYSSYWNNFIGHAVNSGMFDSPLQSFEVYDEKGNHMGNLNIFLLNPIEEDGSYNEKHVGLTLFMGFESLVPELTKDDLNWIQWKKIDNNEYELDSENPDDCFLYNNIKAMDAVWRANPPKEKKFDLAKCTILFVDTPERTGVADKNWNFTWSGTTSLVNSHTIQTYITISWYWEIERGEFHYQSNVNKINDK